MQGVAAEVRGFPEEVGSLRPADWGAGTMCDGHGKYMKQARGILVLTSSQARTPYEHRDRGWAALIEHGCRPGRGPASIAIIARPPPKPSLPSAGPVAPLRGGCAGRQMSQVVPGAESKKPADTRRCRQCGMKVRIGGL